MRGPSGPTRHTPGRTSRTEPPTLPLLGAAAGIGLSGLLAWSTGGALCSSAAGLATVRPFGKLLVFLGMVGLVGLLGLVAAVWPTRRAGRPATPSERPATRRGPE
ncbi:hypothetical protein ACIGXM_07915 [Kitasatospora sp. NPDC052896]|uniref:hypothetical protein n=1 Tax=Kitasatospora sp. NPDC052896 TaxID=3364061 RepID=UPI0037C6AB36